MNTKKVSLCLVAAALALCSSVCLAQEMRPPPGSSSSEYPTGFMIEGLLSATVYTSVSAVTMVNVVAAPAAVIGYKAPAVAIGLGIGFHRGSLSLKDEDTDSYGKDAYTTMLFSPRFEITLFRSMKALAEAYLVAAFGAGFNVYRSDTEFGGSERSDTDAGVALGGHLGLGGRCFLGGGPFALGMEFGWSGMFLNMTDNEADQSTWLNIHGAYAALSGMFVF
jgi:hypothetical protein